MDQPSVIANSVEYVWDRGAYRQRDLVVTQTYDEAYLRERYVSIEDNVKRLSIKRRIVLDAFVDCRRGRLLDFGCGTGGFVEAALDSGWWATGYDIAPWSGDGKRVPWDEAKGGMWDGGKWDVVTFFDSLEHLEAPDEIIRILSPNWLMVSVPWCHHPGRAEWFLPWKHRRPGEHLWHFSREGLDKFLGLVGYKPVMHSCFEDEFRPNPDQAEPNILTGIYRRAK